MNSSFERKNNFPQQNMGASGGNSGNDMFSRRGQSAGGGPNRNQNSGFGGNDGGGNSNFGGNNFNQGMNR